MGANNGWVPQVVLLDHKDGASAATVNDGVIRFCLGKPVEARIPTDNDLSTTYAREIMARDSSGNNSMMIYRLTIMKADLWARIKAIPQGYSNNFDAGGTCKRVKA